MSRLRNIAHDALAVLGVLLLLQAPIVAYLTQFSVKESAVSGAFGLIGGIVTLGSKYVDSTSYTAIATKMP